MRTISFQRKISKARLVFSVCNDFGEQICGFGRCTCGILLQKLTLKWSTPSLAPEPEILTLRQRSWILKILSVIPIISLFVRVPYYFYRNSNYSGHMKYNCGIRAYILRTGLDEYALRLHKNNICSICKNEIQIAKIQKQSDSWFEKNQYTIFMSEKIEDREIPVILLISMFVDVVFYKNYRHLSVYKKEMLYLRTRILQWRIGNLSFFNTFIHFTTDMAEKTVCKIREAQSHPHIHRIEL